MAAPEGFSATAGLAPDWWTPPWDGDTDPDGAWLIPVHAGDAWHETGGRVPLDDSAILNPLKDQFGYSLRLSSRPRHQWLGVRSRNEQGPHVGAPHSMHISAC